MTCFSNNSQANLHIQVVKTIARNYKRRIFLPLRLFLLREPALRKLMSPAKPTSIKIILTITMAFNWSNPAFLKVASYEFFSIFRRTCGFWRIRTMISPSVVTLGLSATAKPVAILLSKIAVTLFPGIFCRDLLTLDSRWIDTSTCWLNKSTDQRGISPNTINTLFTSQTTRMLKTISLDYRVMYDQILTTYIERNLCKSVGRVERSISLQFIITECGFFIGWEVDLNQIPCLPV